MENARPIRVPQAAQLAEGHAKKVRYEAGDELREFLLCRVGGRLFVLDTLCPHEGGRFSEGPLLEGRYAVCPLHLYRFDPRNGRCIGIECDPATVYRVERKGDDVLVWVPRDVPKRADETEREEPEEGRARA